MIFKKTINPSENYTAEDFLSEKEVKRIFAYHRQENAYLTVCVKYLKHVKKDIYVLNETKLILTRTAKREEDGKLKYSFPYHKEKIGELFSSIEGKIEQVTIS